MGLPQPVKRYTPQEYYRLEREAEYRSDYYNGEIFAMAGGTTVHSRIVANIIGELRQRLKGKSCEALDSNQRLKVMATGLRCYPDVSIYCGQMDYDAEDSQRDTATNPTVLFEVLSEGAEGYDRGLKASSYRQIESLRTYVLMAQDRPHVEIYERQPNNSWLFREEMQLERSINLPAVGIGLPLAEVYDRVEFAKFVPPIPPDPRER
jgi:Uma2 family endonuclease